MKSRRIEKWKSQRVVGVINTLFLGGIVCSLTLGLFDSSTLRATTLQKLTLEEMTRAANRIVQAKCLSVESRMEDGRIYTYATFEVGETLAPSQSFGMAGTAGQESASRTNEAKPTIVVRQLGGRVGNLHAMVPGAPVLAQGEEAILFLERDPNARDAFMVVGLSQGHMRILKEPATGRSVVRQSTLGAGVYDPQTRKVRPGTERQVPLEEFKRELQRTLERVQPQGR